MVGRYGDAQLFISKRDICDKIKNRKDNWSALIFVLSYSNSETNIFLYAFDSSTKESSICIGILRENILKYNHCFRVYISRNNNKDFINVTCHISLAKRIYFFNILDGFVVYCKNYCTAKINYLFL